MLAHGTDKPMYLTEFGWATTSQPAMGVTAQQQADYTRQAFQCLQQDSYVQVAIVYELRNNWWANDADNWEDQLGLVTTGWGHKPAYDAFRSIDPNQGGCTYRDSNGTPLGPETALAPDPAPSPASAAGAAQTTGPSAGGAVKHRVTVRVKRDRRARAAASSRRAKRRALTVLGSVAGARAGRVLLRFERRTPHGNWRRSLSLRVKVGRDGRFKRALATSSLGRWRVRAMYVDPKSPAASRFAYFRL
jgi:hypothetical protein